MTKKHPRAPLREAPTKQVRQPRTWTYREYYALGAVILLLATTSYWAYLSAQVNLHNADQLVGQFLFEHGATLHGAVFPGAHTFLLKWPLFALLSFIGTSPLTRIIATILLTLLTVCLLAGLLYKIERRPLVFGTLCLALASVLLLIPTEPYVGALLPVNMAMISTRNIEYILYILALILLIRMPRLRHWKFIAAILLLTLLIASDKLFLALTIGGSLITLILALIRRRSTERRFALTWLAASILAFLLAAGGVWALTHTGILSIQAAQQTSPYAIVHTAKDIFLGTIYALMSLLTNLGANPASDAVAVASIPGTLLRRLLSLSGTAYIVNLGVVCLSAVAISKILRDKVRLVHKRPTINSAQLLSLGLLWTTVTAVLLFIGSVHYYPVDARYVAISTFTAFIILATHLRVQRLSARSVLIAGALITCFGIGPGIISVTQQAARSQDAYAQTAAYNATIAAAIKQHQVENLLGDYWRVMPIKLHDPQQTVLPLGDCFTPRDVLVSHAWESDLHTSSFAYLLSMKPSVSGFPACTIDQVVARYGRPNSSQLIAGSAQVPEEVLLFYDHGINPPPAAPQHRDPATTITATPLAKSARTSCPNSTTVMNIVAHEDDDILFINPATYHNLKAGKCVRSVYITAGDAGGAPLYWLSREEGTRAAYTTMLGLKNPEWVSRTVSLRDKGFATISYLRNNTGVSLLFLHLPDGNMTGRGFGATHYESLIRLKEGFIGTIHSVDNQSSYTSQELIDTLVTLMNIYEPTEVNTQALRSFSQKYPDHSDHLATGWYADQALAQYHGGHPDTTIQHYIGYPIHSQAANVSGEDLTAKEAAFFAYAQHDKGTCESTDACSKMSYRYYLERQYTD